MASHLYDVNLWLALVFERHPHHADASRWWALHQSDASALFCRVTQSAFLRISTGSGFLAALGLSDYSNSTAWRTYELLIQDPRVAFAEEPAGINAVWKQLSAQPTASSGLWTDSYLAAFAINAGYRFVTFDRGFRQFEDAGLDLELLST